MHSDWQPIKYSSVADSDWFPAHIFEENCIPVWTSRKKQNIIIEKYVPTASKCQHRYSVYVPVPDLSKLEICVVPALRHTNATSPRTEETCRSKECRCL